MPYLQRNNPSPQLKVLRSEGGYSIFKVKATMCQYKNVVEGQPITCHNLTVLLASLHQQKNLVLGLPVGAYLRGAKKLLSDYGPDQATKMVMLSAHHCSNSWSFKYILTLAKAEGQQVKRTRIGALIEEVVNG